MNHVHVYKDDRKYSSSSLRSSRQRNNGSCNYNYHKIEFKSKQVGKEVGITYNKQLLMNIQNDLTGMIDEIIEDNNSNLSADISTPKNQQLCQRYLDEMSVDTMTCNPRKLSKYHREMRDLKEQQQQEQVQESIIPQVRAEEVQELVVVQEAEAERPSLLTKLPLSPLQNPTPAPSTKLKLLVIRKTKPQTPSPLELSQSHLASSPSPLELSLSPLASSLPLELSPSPLASPSLPSLIAISHSQYSQSLLPLELSPRDDASTTTTTSTITASSSPSHELFGSPENQAAFKVKLQEAMGLLLPEKQAAFKVKIEETFGVSI